MYERINPTVRKNALEDESRTYARLNPTVYNQGVTVTISIYAL